MVSAVKIYESGLLAYNRASYELLGQPEYVKYAYDPETCIVAIKPVPKRLSRIQGVFQMAYSEEFGYVSPLLWITEYGYQLKNVALPLEVIGGIGMMDLDVLRREE